MIAILSRMVYNGDALSRFRVKPTEFSQHQYYTVGIRAALEVADRIREYNIVRVTVVNGLIAASGNTQDWQFLVLVMKQGDEGDRAIADNIRAALPEVFNSASSSALVKT